MDNVKIYVKPEDVWYFYLNNIQKLKEVQAKIAENTETAYTIFLTEDAGFATITVYRYENQIDEDFLVNKIDCESVVKATYNKYLYPVTVSADKAENDKKNGEEDNTPDDPMAPDDEIYQREDELHMAALDFMEVVLGCDREELEGEYHDVVNDIVDYVCERLADEHMISIYRPMWVQEEDGSESYVEYPYLEEEEVEEAES